MQVRCKIALNRVLRDALSADTVYTVTKQTPQRKANTMANQGFKNTISFLIANGDADTIDSIQWHETAEDLADTIIDAIAGNMVFMGTEFAFGKSTLDIAIEFANVLIKMLKCTWEYGTWNGLDDGLTVSRLNQAKKILLSYKRA